MMLETDEVDTDFFTPLTSTSLANIFGNSNRQDEETENESLKYTPPKAQNMSSKSDEASKVTECVFACALLAYEWIENVYSAKGKVGFAILKVKKTNGHNIVLYDSNKTTLSSATVTPNLEMTVNGNLHISYYDNLNKYWSIYATEQEITKIVELLKTFRVNVKYSLNTDKRLPVPNEVEHQKTNTVVSQIVKDDKGSDTDSSINRRTKHSILSRMASMGHSVLPPHALAAETISDSSDTNENNDYPKITRHKPVKGIVKRVNTDKIVHDVPSLINTHKIVATKADPSVDADPLYKYINGQLVPVTNTNIITNSGGTSGYDMNFFITEQRISNSELRINMNRMTDKVDQVLNNIKDLGNTDKSTSISNFQIETMQKLLNEYENKIKMYEEIITADKKSNNSTFKQLTKVPQMPQDSEIESYQNKLSELEEMMAVKNNEITELKKEVNELKEKLDEFTTKQIVNEDSLLKEIKDLKQALRLKNEEMVDVRKTLEERKEIDVGIKLKSIMNDTFQAISINIENNENYSGEAIKSVIATVIKKITIESLSEYVKN